MSMSGRIVCTQKNWIDSKLCIRIHGPCTTKPVWKRLPCFWHSKKGTQWNHLLMHDYSSFHVLTRHTFWQWSSRSRGVYMLREILHYRLYKILCVQVHSAFCVVLSQILASGSVAHGQNAWVPYSVENNLVNLNLSKRTHTAINPYDGE